jgi:predicted amidohydrolase YtcJ
LFTRDLFALPREEIMSAKAALTMVDGKVVFEA